MRVVGLLSVVGFVLVACSSSNSTSPDGGGPDATSNEGGGGKDATATDSSTNKDTAPSDSSSGDTTPTDSGGETSTDGGTCAGLKKPAMCMTCCTGLYPKGGTELVTAELACACDTIEDGGTHTLCGPVDGGKPDAGEFGEGACSTAECGGTAKKMEADCTECVTRATGTKTKPGACYASVHASCADAGSECAEYAKCLEDCAK
jgi:hypothetical protein